MSGELARRPANVLASADVMGEAQFDNVSRMAKALAASGQFKDITQWEQAFGRILLGSDMGLTPTQALMSIDVVRGNVQVRGKRLLAWIKQSEGYDYDILERTPERGAIQFFAKSKRTGEWEKVGPRPSEGAEPGPIVFTLEQAKAKGLWAKGGGWDNWPENMCLWRCASIGFNLFCPELSGGVAVYTEADSFDVESSATEIGRGEGDGSEPGWDGLTPDQVVLAEGVIAEADRVGYAPLSSAARASLQMKLCGQDTDTVDNRIMDWQDELEKFKAES